MKLIKKGRLEERFSCELTTELDKLIQAENEYEEHYVHVDDFSKKEKCLAVRVPGRTVGGIELSDDNTIIAIDIPKDCFFFTYPDELDEVLAKFIGMKIEY